MFRLYIYVELEATVKDTRSDLSSIYSNYSRYSEAT